MHTCIRFVREFTKNRNKAAFTFLLLLRELRGNMCVVTHHFSINATSRKNAKNIF